MGSARRVDARDSAPAWSYPVLGLIERIDRRVRHIRAVRPAASVIALEQRRWRGPPVDLADGTRVRRGDRVPVIHFENARLRALAGRDWQSAAYEVAREDLRALASWHAALPDGERPVAYTGASVLAVLSRRTGFELRPRKRTVLVRLEEWYLRTLLARWAPDGTARLRRGRRPLVSQRVWLSGAQLLRRWGPGESAR